MLLVVEQVRQVLTRQLVHARRGFTLSRQREEVREAALEWLALHPSGRADVDECWREALCGDSEFSRFLQGDGSLDAWTGGLPLRCLVSSHPFPDLWRWSVPR